MGEGLVVPRGLEELADELFKDLRSFEESKLGYRHWFSLPEHLCLCCHRQETYSSWGYMIKKILPYGAVVWSFAGHFRTPGLLFIGTDEGMYPRSMMAEPGPSSGATCRRVLGFDSSYCG